jgi:hypothetical protein
VVRDREDVLRLTRRAAEVPARSVGDAVGPAAKRLS